jgi:hypothetical protein
VVHSLSLNHKFLYSNQEVLEPHDQQALKHSQRHNEADFGTICERYSLVIEVDAGVENVKKESVASGNPGDCECREENGGEVANKKTTKKET